MVKASAGNFLGVLAVGLTRGWFLLLPRHHWFEGSQGQLQIGHKTASKHSHRDSPGSYEVILFLSILGKNSKYKIILIKVKIHHLDFVVL